MKVGIFANNVTPELGGGYSLQKEILNAIQKHAIESKHEFYIFVPKSKKNVIKESQVKVICFSNGTLIRLKYKFYCVINELFLKIFGINLINSMNSLENIAKKHKIDIIWYITQNAYLVNIPYIYTVWDLQHRLQPYFPEVTLKGQWEIREKYFRTLIPRASILITGTNEGAKDISNFYSVSKDRIKIVPFPTPSIALEASLDGSRKVLKKYNLTPNYLFYPAQFWSHKNHVNILFALEVLKRKYKLDLSVVFVGSDMGNKKYIHDMVEKLELTSQVNFLGFVSNEELIELYRNAFALVMMTYFGPDNLPPLEAFALSCPVIASDVPGAKEQLGNAAMFVNPKDEESIAKCIWDLYESPKKRGNLINLGLTKASMWTSEKYFERVCGILDDFESVRRCWK